MCCQSVSFFADQSFNEGTLPSDWLKANIAPIYKKGDRSIPANYRPISLTSVCCKASHGTYNLSCSVCPT